ncbi:hypothetical protein JW935_27845 [candidate division KSB1 bacterium]|nr:hypothetical protein [candidate division KSB1 bacterium]
MKKLLFVYFLICMLTLSVFAQEEYRGVVSNEFRHRIEDYKFRLTQDKTGARGLAMGGAQIAASTNIAAIYWNPAGLTTVNGLQVAFDATMSFNSITHDPPRFTGIALSTDMSPFVGINNAAVGYGLRLGSRSLTIGLGYDKFINMNMDSKTKQYHYGGDQVLEEDRLIGGIQTVKPAIAVDVFSFLSVGVTYNTLFGKSEYELKIVSPYADRTVYFRFADQEEYSGSFADIGIQLDPLPWLSAGLTFRPRWKIEITEKSESFNELMSLENQRLIWETPQDSLDVFEYSIPMRMGAGLAIRPWNHTTFAVDISSMSWSDVELSTENRSRNPMQTKMFDVLDWHAGLEHIADSGDWIIPLRLGYFSTQTPYKDKLFNWDYLGDQIGENGWSVGFGIERKALKLNFAFVRKGQKSGWWMQASDYYNHRMFSITKEYNEIFLGVVYRFF